MKLLIFDLLQLPVCSCDGQLSRCICKWTMSQARSSCQERQQMSQKTRRPEPIFVPREWAGKKGPHVATNISKWAEFKPVNPPSLLNIPTVSGGSFLDNWTGVTEAKPTDSSTCRHTQARFGQDCLKRGWETFSLSVLAVWALLPPISATHQPPLSSTWDKSFQNPAKNSGCKSNTCNLQLQLPQAFRPHWRCWHSQVPAALWWEFHLWERCLCWAGGPPLLGSTDPSFPSVLLAEHRSTYM